MYVSCTHTVSILKEAVALNISVCCKTAIKCTIISHRVLEFGLMWINVWQGTSKCSVDPS